MLMRWRIISAIDRPDHVMLTALVYIVSARLFYRGPSTRDGTGVQAAAEPETPPKHDAGQRMFTNVEPRLSDARPCSGQRNQPTGKFAERTYQVAGKDEETGSPSERKPIRRNSIRVKHTEPEQRVPHIGCNQHLKEGVSQPRPQVWSRPSKAEHDKRSRKAPKVAIVLMLCSRSSATARSGQRRRRRRANPFQRKTGRSATHRNNRKKSKMPLKIRRLGSTLGAALSASCVP